MYCRLRLSLVLLAIASSSTALAQPAAPKPLPPRASRDSLDGPPLVSAKAWIALDAKSGKAIGGEKEAVARPMASTTKIMTAFVVLSLANKDEKILDEVVTFSEIAAKVPGSSSKLLAGDALPVSELLYGLLLPSGNDASVALAEHFGPRIGKPDEREPVARFVREMNRQASELGLKEMHFEDPHGLSRENVTSVRDLATLARTALADKRFLKYVNTRRHEYEVKTATGDKRKMTWNNTNKLLGIEGFDGVKTGTTTPAGNCLVASGKRGEDHILVVVLGSTTADGRYIDARNLFRWVWQERGHKE